jgi:hypothetical protein
MEGMKKLKACASQVMAQAFTFCGRSDLIKGEPDHAASLLQQEQYRF